MKNLITFLSLALITSCSSVQVTYDYDKQTDFSQFKTYALTKESLELPVSELNRDRVIKAVQDEMKTKGFTESDNPDIAVDLFIKTQQEIEATATTTGAGYGPYRYGWGGGFTTTQVDYNQYTNGSLFISFVNMKTQKLVWQGIGTKTLDENLSPDKREQAINYSIQQILSKYPPQ